MQNKQTSSTLPRISDRDLSFISKAYESIVLLKSLNNFLDIIKSPDLYKIIARFALANLGAATQSLSYECTTEIYPNLSNLLFAKTQGSVNTAWWSNDRFALAHTLNISEMLVDIDANFREELKAANLVFNDLKRILAANKERINNYSIPQNFKLVDVSIDLSKYFPTYDITDVNDCLDFLKKVSALEFGHTRSILLAVGFEILGNCVSKYSAELEKVSSKKEIRFLRNRIAHEGSVVSCIKTNYVPYISMLSDFDGVIPARKKTAPSESSSSTVDVEKSQVATQKQNKKSKVQPVNNAKPVAINRRVNNIWSFENDLSVGVDPKVFEAIKEFKKQFPNIIPEDGLYNREFFSRTFYNAAVGIVAAQKDSPYNEQLFEFVYQKFVDFIDFSWRIFVFKVNLESRGNILDSEYELSPSFVMSGIVCKKDSISSVMLYGHAFKFIGYPLKHVKSIERKLMRLEGEKGHGLGVLDALTLFYSPKSELSSLKYRNSGSILSGAKIIKEIQELIDTENDPQVMPLLDFYQNQLASQVHRDMIVSFINDGFLNAIDSNAPTKWDDGLPFWIHMIASRFPCLDLNMKRSCDFRQFKRNEDYLVDVNLNFFAAWVNYRLSFISTHNVEGGALENEKGTNMPKVFRVMERKIYPVILDRAYSLFFCDSSLLRDICDSKSKINEGKSHSLLSYLAIRLDYLEKTPKNSIINFPLLRGVFEKLYLVFFLWNEIIGLDKDDVVIDLIQGEFSVEKLSILSEELPKIQDRRFGALAKIHGLPEKINLAQAIAFVLPEEVLIDLEPNSPIAKYVELHKTSLPEPVQAFLKKAASSNSLITAVDYIEDDRKDRQKKRRYEYLSSVFKKEGHEGLAIALQGSESFEKLIEESRKNREIQKGESQRGI